MGCSKRLQGDSMKIGDLVKYYNTDDFDTQLVGVIVGGDCDDTDPNLSVWMVKGEDGDTQVHFERHLEVIA